MSPGMSGLRSSRSMRLIGLFASVPRRARYLPLGGSKSIQEVKRYFDSVHERNRKGR